MLDSTKLDCERSSNAGRNLSSLISSRVQGHPSRKSERSEHALCGASPVRFHLLAGAHIGRTGTWDLQARPRRRTRNCTKNSVSHMHSHNAHFRIHASTISEKRKRLPLCDDRPVLVCDSCTANAVKLVTRTSFTITKDTSRCRRTCFASNAFFVHLLNARVCLGTYSKHWF